MRSALVTGSTGFLGQHLCRGIRARDRQRFLVGLVRDGLSEAEINTDAVVLGDLADVALLERAIAEYEVDTVVHLAAQTAVGVATASPTGTLEANVRGTWNLLEACRRQKVDHVVIASSDKAYGGGPIPYREEQPLEPHGIYATSKTCVDFIAQSYVREFKLPVATTRCANLYGPGHTNWSTLIPGTIRSLLRGERPVIRSDGSPERDYLFVEDAVDGYLRIMEKEVVGAWNFGTGRARSALDVVRSISAAMHSDLEPLVIGAAREEIDAQAVAWNKANNALGWRPEHDLEAGLRKTIPWYEAQRERWTA